MIEPSADPMATLFAKLAPQIDVASDDAAFVRSLFTARRFRKGEFYQRAGDITSHGGFVAQGCFRTYVLDAEGKENITHFSAEHGWVGDIQSARAQRATQFYVDAIEPAQLLVIALSDFDRMLDRFPDMARGYRLGLERANAVREHRVALALNATAEERYLDFIERYPSLASRIPQRMLASHLGIAPETLSRVRRKRRET